MQGLPSLDEKGRGIKAGFSVDMLPLQGVFVCAVQDLARNLPEEYENFDV